MNLTDHAYRRISGGTNQPETSEVLDRMLFADMRLWYEWHRSRGSLPGNSDDTSQGEVAKELGLPEVRYLRPWEISCDGGVDEHDSTDEKRRWRFGADGKLLEAVWQIGPDGDFWQTGYPVKTTEDLDVLIGYLETRSYRFLPERIVPVDDALTIIELPSRPFAWLMLEILGWSDGLMLLMDAEDAIRSALKKAQEQVSSITQAVCESGSRYILLSPDNLDAQFISPGFFGMYLAESYESLCALAGAGGHATVVHTGGPIGGLVPLLAGAGVSGLVGVSEPPQGDAGLGKICELSDGKIVPWGGIPQDLLMPTVGEAEALDGVDAVLAEAKSAGGALLGIADHVPIEAEAERVAVIAERVRRQS